MRSIILLTKQCFIYGLLGLCVLGLTSTNYDTVKTNHYTENLTFGNYNAKKLVNTTWKIKYADCNSCTERADDIRFMDLGKGYIEQTPIRWFLKNDTVHLVTDIEGCRFDKVFLADETLMYGHRFCDNDKKTMSFIARKKIDGDNNNPVAAAIPSHIVIPPAFTTPVTAKPLEPKETVRHFSSEYLDKTYMFKRGIEKFYGERRIDAIILHSSFCVHSRNDFDLYCVLGEYKRHGVAAHYVIDREGNTHRLVKENDIAFHAGFGKMPDGNNNINTRSLGIELINSEDEGPNEYQYAALANLVRDIKSRHRIKYIKGHNQICPGRKSDPWKFSWKKMYDLVEVEKP